MVGVLRKKELDTGFISQPSQLRPPLQTCADASKRLQGHTLATGPSLISIVQSVHHFYRWLPFLRPTGAVWAVACLGSAPLWGDANAAVMGRFLSLPLTCLSHNSLLQD